MRLPFALRVTPFVCLAPALLLAGCGMGVQDTTHAAVTGHAHGTVFGGQQPVKGAVITVYSVGYLTYGTGATALASTTTDNSGSFAFGTTPSNTYTCNGDPLTYIVARGGDSGTGTNNDSIELIATLQDCQTAQNTTVNINEVTTAATATSMSHFFSTAVGASVTPNLGAPNQNGDPSIYNVGLGNAMFGIGTLVDITTGTAQPNFTTGPADPNATSSIGNVAVTTESAKLNSFANVIASCVNTAGTTGPTDTTSACAQLFTNTTYQGKTPATTFQAALSMALYPFNNAATLFNLAPPKSPFVGLQTAPSDWTIATSFTFPGYGLSIQNGTSVSMDIDPFGSPYIPATTFPSGTNGGAVFFLASGTDVFANGVSGLGVTHPQYLAIDSTTNQTVWITDQESNNVGKFENGIASTLTATYTSGGPVFVDANNDAVLTGTTSNGLYTNYNIAFGGAVINPNSSTPFTGAPTGMIGDGSTSSQTTFASTSNGQCKLESLADTTNTVLANNGMNNCSSGGIVRAALAHNSPSFISVATTTNQLCLDNSNCSTYVGLNAPQGIAVDGDGDLWVANSGDSSVAMLAPATGSPYTPQAVSPVAYAHGAANGGTLTRPYGISIDGTGNVWVANAGCVSLSVIDCTPGNLVITEIFGAAAPTITPRAAAAQLSVVTRPQQ